MNALKSDWIAAVDRAVTLVVARRRARWGIGGEDVNAGIESRRDSVPAFIIATAGLADEGDTSGHDNGQAKFKEAAVRRVHGQLGCARPTRTSCAVARECLLRGFAKALA
jgi:hypothetical protein